MGMQETCRCVHGEGAQIDLLICPDLRGMHLHITLAFVRSITDEQKRKEE